MKNILYVLGIVLLLSSCERKNTDYNLTTKRGSVEKQMKMKKFYTVSCGRGCSKLKALLSFQSDDEKEIECSADGDTIQHLIVGVDGVDINKVEVTGEWKKTKEGIDGMNVVSVNGKNPGEDFYIKCGQNIQDDNSIERIFKGVFK